VILLTSKKNASAALIRRLFFVCFLDLLSGEHLKFICFILVLKNAEN